MATSGLTLGTISTYNIVREALELIGVLGEGEVGNDAQYASLTNSLNAIALSWQAAGLNLAAVETAAFLLVPGQSVYRLPAYASGTRIESGRVAVAAPAGGTGVVARAVWDNGTTTGQIPCNTAAVVIPATESAADATEYLDVASITGDTIYLNTPLVNAVPEGTEVFIAPARTSGRFMKALSGTYHAFEGTDIPMTQLSRQEYQALNRKDSSGVPLQFFVDTQAAYNDVYIWPTATHRNQQITLTIQRQLDAMLSGLDDISFPVEWTMPLVTALAYVGAAKYGLPRDETMRLKDLADHYYEMAEGFDFEWGTSITFSPDMR